MDKKSLEIYLGELLLEKGLRLAVAESCTGGLVGHLITNVPGSSGYFLGGVMAYADETKMNLLGVQQQTLETYGAVSQETALEMAAGVRRVLEADVGAAISGIAGPGGGTPEKPVGLTWIGLSAPGVEAAWSYVWQGDRLAVKEQSARQVLRLLVGYLLGQLPDYALAIKDDHRLLNMEFVEVTARFDADGKIVPLNFSWHEKKYKVTSVGRSREDEAGRHILVMTPGDRIYELVFVPEESLWYLRPLDGDRMVS